MPTKILRAELKAAHGLQATQVHCNLTYLLSQEWVEDQAIKVPEVGLEPTRACAHTKASSPPEQKFAEP